MVTARTMASAAVRVPRRAGLLAWYVKSLCRSEETFADGDDD
ncbi:hypothetical protein DAI22_06g092650 [Oryza sativa Japonica Group]|nr:hypothetical protein DAI22_06g092650 [Oryza sativa Japonica Group]